MSLEISPEWIVANINPTRVEERSGKRFAVWDVAPGKSVEVEMRAAINPARVDASHGVDFGNTVPVNLGPKPA